MGMGGATKRKVVEILNALPTPLPAASTSRASCRGPCSAAEFSAAMERSARFVAVLPLHHGGGSVADEFSENRDRRFASTVEPINTYAVGGVGEFRDLEHIGRSAVVKFHGQRIRREDVVGDVTAPLSGDVFVCRRVGEVCRTGRKQNCNRCKPRIFHELP